MLKGYDGTIRFDTKIDTTGVNKGVSKIGNVLKGIGKILAGIGKALAIGFLVVIIAIVGAIVALFRAIFSIGKIAASAIAGASKKVMDQAKKLEELKQAFANIKNAITDAFRPLILAALPWIIMVTNAVLQLLNLIAQVIASLTGQEGYWKTVENGANAAGEAAEGALAGFDKLNVLDKNAGGGGGAGGPGQEWVPIEDEAQSLADRIRALFEEGDWYELGLSIGQKFSEGIDNIPWSEIGKSISDGIIGVLDFSTGFIEGINWSNLGAGIAESINNIDWIGVAASVAEGISSFVTGIFDLFIGFIEELDWMKLGSNLWNGLVELVENINWGGIISKAFELIGSLLGAAAALMVGLGTAIWEFLKGAWETVKEFFDPFIEDAGGDIWQGLLDGISIAIVNIGNWIQEHIIDPFMEGFKKAFGIESPSTLMAEQGEPIIEGLKQGILDAWASVYDWIQEKIVEPLKEWFSQAWEDIKSFAEGAWDGVKLAWESATTWFQDEIIDPLTEAWDTATGNIKSFFEDTWTDIKDLVKGFVNDIIGFINGMINGAVNGINNLIDIINTLSWTVPWWVPLIGGETFGFNFSHVSAPQIPYLAQGAVIPPNAQFLAVLGDQRSGRNLEAPESLIRKIVREEAGNAKGQEVTINFAGDLSSLIRVLKPYIDKENKRTGKSLVVGRAA